jgi:hypothetical protein
VTATASARAVKTDASGDADERRRIISGMTVGQGLNCAGMIADDVSRPHRAT